MRSEVFGSDFYMLDVALSGVYVVYKDLCVNLGHLHFTARKG